MLGRRWFLFGLLVLGLLSGAGASAQTSRFAYVADGGDRKILRFQIQQPSGALTPLTPPVSTASQPTSLAMDPSGTYLFVASLEANNVSVYSIDAGGGLAELKGSPVQTGGSSPSFVTVAPASTGGTYALVTNQSSNDVSVITLDKEGRPTLLGQPVPTGGTGPNSVAVRANGANV